MNDIKIKGVAIYYLKQVVFKIDLPVPIFCRQAQLLLIHTSL